MKKVNIALIGFGTIGTGVVKALAGKRLFIKKKRGLELELVRIADKDLRTKRPVKVSRKKLTKKAGDILNDPNIDIVIELIGGIHPAKEFVIKALESGKHVVTANKALLAACGKEIFKVAKKCGVTVRFEASVGGGIPVVKALSGDFVANRIQAVYGIINGTSNYILTKMEEEGETFNGALKKAKGLGIAESNPTLDINGMDSAHKLAILSLLGFGRYVDVGDIFTEGIQSVELQDIQYAKELGYSIKLLAIAKKDEGKLDVRVHPTLLTTKHLLAGVRGAQNAIYIKGDMIGESLLYGEGAGEKATSSAIISDVTDIAEAVAAGKKMIMPEMNFDSGVSGIKGIGRVKSRYYIRFMAMDKPGVLAGISGILAKYKISISSVSQKERNKEHAVPIVMLTHEAIEMDLRKALGQINKLNSISGKPVAIRMEMR
ncbi:MAG: homoserine dehydrogenase [Candidatus Omnitrophica bacterium]|nr:homoserine dehydrogenase [Candidatus Omnitrophota bacterium]